MTPFLWRMPALAAIPLVLAACASLPPDGGRATVAALVAERGRSVPDVRAESAIAALVADKIAAPLTSDDAIAIAYLQTPRLRAAYARLGLAAADVYDAGRLSNPRLSIGLLFGGGVGSDELTFGLTQSFTDLLFLRARTKVAHAAFAEARARAGQDILDVATDVERAYLHLVATERTAATRAKSADLARAGAELARRFHAAGNISSLGRAAEEAAASEARLAAVTAAAEVETARAELNRLMGFRAAAAWTVTTDLAPPPPQDASAEQIIAAALRTRLDLVARRDAITARAAALGLSERVRWLGGAEAGVVHKRESGGIRQTGPALAVELPVFNSGKGKVARAAASLDAALADLEEAEIATANEIRAAVARLDAARARAADYRTRLLPARAAIVARMQEEVNFMLRSPFDLLRARRQEYDAEADHDAALRDYWVVRAELARAAGGRLPAPTAAVPPEKPDDEKMDEQHMKHGDAP